VAREGGRVSGNETGEVGQAVSCWSTWAVVRDLDFNLRVMGSLRRAGLPALLSPSLLESFEQGMVMIWFIL
jgi:hypothetical protein